VHFITSFLETISQYYQKDVDLHTRTNVAQQTPTNSNIISMLQFFTPQCNCNITHVLHWVRNCNIDVILLLVSVCWVVSTRALIYQSVRNLVKWKISTLINQAMDYLTYRIHLSVESKIKILYYKERKYKRCFVL